MTFKSAFYRTYNYLRMLYGGGQELVLAPTSSIACFLRNQRRARL